MKFLKKLSDWLLGGIKPTNSQKPARRYVRDVKAGETIQIEWDRIKGKIGAVTCLSNDPQSKKILIHIRWGNYEEMGRNEYEKIILDYNGEELKNFHLLNCIEDDFDEDDFDEDDFDLATLQKKMNEALGKEEYEKADELQKKIDKLSNKK